MSLEDDTERIREELKRLQPVIEEITGMASRWTGQVDLVPNARFRGLKPFRCDILLDAALAGKPTRWRTLLENIRGVLGQDTEFFYLTLLRTPIRQRYSFLVQQCL